MRHRHLLLYSALMMLPSAACAPLLPTPDDFPQPPWTPAGGVPTFALPPTSAPRPMSKPIYPDDMVEARTFFLLVKIGMAAGDSAMVAERTLYPFEVTPNGQPATIGSAAEFERHFQAIVDANTVDAVYATDESDLVLLPAGAKAANGILWLNLFCVDPACAEARLLITQINS
ncbi:MAG: hypothetical protein V1755_14715 [Chloroflexota bacterium]